MIRELAIETSNYALGDQPFGPNIRWRRDQNPNDTFGRHGLGLVRAWVIIAYLLFRQNTAVRENARRGSGRAMNDGWAQAQSRPRRPPTSTRSITTSAP